MIYWHHAAKYRHTEEYTDGGKEIISPSGVAEAAPWDGACCFGRKYTGPSDPLAREMDDFLWEVQTAERMSRSYYLALTLAAAPMMEEAVFRLGIYGLLRRKLRPKAAAFLSALAFGFYHGNMIQGLYAFLLGFVLAWGYEKCPWGKYRMAVLMHAAANGAALLAFG